MFKEINCKEIGDNIFRLIGDDWLLVSASAETGSCNVMTASWGMAGILWNRPVAQIFIRPTRYTMEFLESGDKFALCVFPPELKGKIHSVCGKKSGRDTDKIKETGITPISQNGYTYFEEARLVLLCETIYKDDIKPECMIDKSIEANYDNDYHRAYIGEIKGILKKQ